MKTPENIGDLNLNASDIIIDPWAYALCHGEDSIFHVNNFPFRYMLEKAITHYQSKDDEVHINAVKAKRPACLDINLNGCNDQYAERRREYENNRAPQFNPFPETAQEQSTSSTFISLEVEVIPDDGIERENANAMFSPLICIGIPILLY